MHAQLAEQRVVARVFDHHRVAGLNVATRDQIQRVIRAEGGHQLPWPHIDAVPGKPPDKMLTQRQIAVAIAIAEQAAHA